MSKELIDAYKALLDNIFSRSKGVLGETFITKLIKKGEKIANDGGISLLNGIEYKHVKNYIFLEI